MTKEQVLELIASMNWEEQSWKKSPAQIEIEQAVAQFVVYQTDPDSQNAYGHKFYLNKEDAMADFESRTTSDNWCNCTIADLHSGWRQVRKIY